MHSRRMFLALGAIASLVAAVAMPSAEAQASVGPDFGRGDLLMVAYDTEHNPQVIARYAFVDGVYVVPGGEQLRVFYRDQVYAPKRLTMVNEVKVAAMQPDNGAGQVSGDRAQSVGKAGDLKATIPGQVKAQTPGAKVIDAGKQSWLRRIGPWLFGQPAPS